MLITFWERSMNYKLSMSYKLPWSERLKYPLIAASLAVAGSFAWSAAQAAPIPLGFISWDVTVPGSFGQFDITNQTGPNSFPPTFPVSTEVQFNTLGLVVHFSDGSTTTFGPSYFTLNADGESWDGSPIAIGGASPKPTEGILTGDLTPTTIDVSGMPTTVDSSFDTATVLPSSPPDLADGDNAIINAEPGTAGPTVPEPDMTLTFLIGGFMVVIFARRRDGWKRLFSSARFSGGVGAVFAVAAILLPAVSFAQTLSQNTASTPGSGVAGVTFLNITASGFPSGPINPANVTIRLAPTCPVGATGPVAGEADATATSVKKILGSTERVNFEVPSTLLTGPPVPEGTYLAQIVDTTDGFAGGNCSIVVVSNTNPVLNACVPSSSMGVVTGTSVTAYVPKSCWDCSATSGVGSVEIEPTLGGSSTVIPTRSPVNACAGNPATGEVVCTGNNTDVFLINGTTLSTTLTSGLTGTAGFSGGSCHNCGVAINALTDTAAIAGGFSGGGDAVQILNLGSNTFQPPFHMTQGVSENISIDPGRNLILSPNEASNYPLLSLNSSTGAVTGEFDRATGSGENDSAAEDCSTGIALSSVEFTDFVYLADLSQATFTSGSPGSWTSPSTLFTFTGTNLSFAAGTSGISAAQGSSHLAIVTGEFGGNTFGIMQLQSASGTGGANPAVVDWVVGAMPNTPDGNGFTAGLDPHTVTAYTSPNTGKAIGLYADWPGGVPKFIGVIDMAAALAAPRQAGLPHQIASSVNLITSGIVTYVAVP
jgi:hypothetical protein